MKAWIVTAACVMVLALAGCTSNRQDGSTAHEAGREAYKAGQEAKKAAKDAGQKLRKAAREAREGWNEAKREDTKRDNSKAAETKRK